MAVPRRFAKVAAWVVALAGAFALASCQPNGHVATENQGDAGDETTRSEQLPSAVGTVPLETAADEGTQDTVPSSRLDAILSDPGEDFARAEVPRDFGFPRDHGPHPDFRHEWWYFTGNLDAQSGERFGFELTFFRFALAPGDDTVDDRADDRSHWRTRQIYMAHFAVTDVGREQFHFAERFARGALGLAGAQASPFRVWLGEWKVEDTASVESSRDSNDNETAWRLHARDGEYTLTLDLHALQPPVLNGEHGLSRKSGAPGAASYYYSMPRLEARGTLSRGGQTFEVRGLAWLDREWGSGALDVNQEGWDWFALQLGDGSAIMFYALRHHDGDRDPHSAGTWISPDGRTRRLLNDDVQIDVLDHWTSPRGGRYPASWRLSVPSLALQLTIRPVLADQELVTSTARYWEGAVNVSGLRQGKAVTGRGYVELVGYARDSRDVR